MSYSTLSVQYSTHQVSNWITRARYSVWVYRYCIMFPTILHCSTVKKYREKIDPNPLIQGKVKSFLQQQVRSMVGCLKAVGEKKWSIKKLHKCEIIVKTISPMNIMKIIKIIHCPNKIICDKIEMMIN